MLLAFLASSIVVDAQIEVNSAVPITHQVFVNRIRTASSSGAQAMVFGNEAQEADIISKINLIWSQVGVEVVFSDISNYTSDFAYNNNNQNPASTRPSSHLNTILALAEAPRSTVTTDVEMFFVEIVPAFNQVSDNTANGYATIDGFDATIHIGSNLVSFAGGRDVIAGVVAHEIGHNLGLPHTANGIGNLMSPGGITEQLTADQKLAIFTNNNGTDGYDLLIPATPALSNYQQFVVNYSLTQGPNGDDDGDGISNLTEFALGMNPKTVRNQLPAANFAGSTLTWTITKNAEAVVDGLTYEIIVSSDLATFQPAGTSGSNSDVTVNNDTTLTAQLSSPSTGFMQLRVSLPVGAAGVQVTPDQQAELAAADARYAGPLVAEKCCACSDH